MKDMIPILVLFGLMIWYFGEYSPRGHEIKPEITRKIRTKNVDEYQ